MAEFKPTFDWLKQRPLCLLAFGFGSGLAPVAPGTFGTMAALPIAFLLVLVGIDGWILAFLCVALFMWGIRICNHTEKALIGKINNTGRLKIIDSNGGELKLTSLGFDHFG